jgi:hypothetical protein
LLSDGPLLIQVLLKAREHLAYQRLLSLIYLRHEDFNPLLLPLLDLNDLVEVLFLYDFE